MGMSPSGLAAPRLIGRWSGSEPGGGVKLTADGRFAIWYQIRPTPSTMPELFVFDRVTRLGQRFPGIPFYGGGLIVDPSRPRLFIADEQLGRLTVVEPGAVRMLDLGAQWIVDKVSADGRVLFAHRCVQSMPFPPYFECTFAKRDSSTGAILSEMRLPPGFGRLAMAPSETELFAITEIPGVFPRDTAVRRLDAISGVETGSIRVPVNPSSPVGGPGALIVHDGGQRFTVSLADGSPPFRGALWTVDTSTSPWTEIALVPTAAPPALAQTAGAPSFTATNHPFRNGSQGFCDAGTLDLVSPLTGTAVQSLPLPAGGCVRTALAWVQPAGNLSATVAGNVVSLFWETSPSSGVQHVVEAGSASGLSNLARLAVPTGATSITVADVPAGTYFVRVRAVNAVGTSEPSNEIVVNVP
jgi:hypothetical protein